MSTELSTLVGSALPAHFNTADTSVADAALGGLGGGGSDHPRLSIRASRFRIVEDGVETPINALAIKVVIVGANPYQSKVFYSATYDEAEAAAPDCWSDDFIRPDASVSSPQSTLCANCPQNVWGSKMTPQGKKTRACSDLKRLAVVSADDLSGTIYELTVPASSLKGLQKYIKDLRDHRVPTNGVVTTLSFDDKASYPKLEFNATAMLDANEYAVIQETSKRPEVKEYTRTPAETPAPAEATPASAPALPDTAPATPVAPEPAAPTFGAAPQPQPVPEAQPAQTAATPFDSGPVAAAQPAPDLQPAPAQAAAKSVGDVSAFESEIDAFLNAGGK